MKQLSTLTLLLLLYVVTTAQSVWENPITGHITSTTNPYTTGDIVADGITVSGIGASTGISVITTNDRYNASTWDAAAFNAGDFFTFTLTPDAGQFIHFENLNFSYQKSGTGPTNYSLRSSVDNFTSDISEGLLLSSGSFSVSLPSSTFRNVSTAIEFRLYAWGSTSPSGTFSVNDFAFNGTVSNAALPVTFGAIEATEKGERLNVQWTTFKEINNDRFELELSYNGIDFKTVKVVKSQNGNSEIPRHYDITISLNEVATSLMGLPFLLIFLFFRLRRRMWLSVLLATMVSSSVGIVSCTKSSTGDLEEAAGKQLFIRIKQVDKDGTQTFSKVVKVTRH